MARAGVGLQGLTPWPLICPPATAELARSVNATAAQAAAAAAAAAAASGQQASADEEDEAAAEERASWSLERATAEELVAALVAQWQKPIDTLGKAGRAFDVSWGWGWGGSRRGRRQVRAAEEPHAFADTSLPVTPPPPCHPDTSGPGVTAGRRARRRV